MARTDTSIKNGNAPEKAVANDVDAIKEDITALRSDLRALITDAGAVAKLKSQRGIDQGVEMAEDVKTKATEVKSSLEDRVREKPFAAVGIALGAGFLLSSLTRR